MITVKNVSKIFGKKSTTFTALQNIGFTIPDGASVAIIGKSGSGKSTLMHVMSGLDHVSTGSVVFDDQEITTMSQKNADKFRAREMSFIFQAFFIEPNRTCIDNVMLPLEIANVPKSQRVELAENALISVELFDKRNVDAKDLSGGQKQRLAVARAIVNKPKLLFADEPTGNLDSTTGETVMDLLFTLNKKLKSTLIIVTHDEDLAAMCDMQIKLRDGSIDKVTARKPKKSETKK